MATESIRNITTIGKTPNASDYFCTELFVGPLVWGIFCVPCACVGVPASVWLLWVLIQRQRSRLSNDIYMLNLTVMDLLFNAFIIPDVVNVFVLKDELFWLTTGMVQFFSACGRPLLMVSVCVDCYIAVVHPVMYMTLKRSKYRMVICTGIWVLTVCWALVFVFDKPFVHYAVWNIPSVLTLLSTILCDIAIFCALRKPDPSGRSRIHPQKRRALQALINSLVMTIVSYLVPIVTEVILLLVSVSPQVLRCSIIFPLLVFPMVGTTIMPLLHLGNLGHLTVPARCGCDTNNV